MLSEVMMIQVNSEWMIRGERYHILLVLCPFHASMLRFYISISLQMNTFLH